ncbi:MAG: hypothetical protein ISN26_04460 [Betaproteobacteria bacterium AqS2]|uniref:Uncharacterized protein n=1 Tax=Candidatus Amphirhobacter heronislandensis TaxID=1732024 RepID=A0A930XXY3_9GAMM|nr:hypothetical protein [Betaproteobacteria bacterium AqS2]
MHWIGVLGAGFGKFSGHALPPSVWHDDLLQRLLYYPLQAVRNDWLPYIPLLWYAAWRIQLRQKRQAVPPAARAADRLLVFGALYLVASSILSVQPLSLQPNPPIEIDSRYFFCVIPFFAPLKAMLAYWLWVRSRWAGPTHPPTLSILSTSSATNLLSGPACCCTPPRSTSLTAIRWMR